MNFLTPHRRAASALAGVLAMSVLAACGTNDPSSEESDVDSAGSAASSDGETIKIGFASVDTGAVPWPFITEAVNVAAEHLNENGGLLDRQIDIVTCDTKGEEAASQACGQQFANDPDIAFTIAPMNLALEAYVGAVGDKPTFVGLAITPGQDSLPNSYSYLTAVSGTFVAYSKYVVDDLGAESVTFIHEDDAAMNSAAALVKSMVEPAGVDFTDTVVPVAATDILPQVSASGADTADAVILMGPSNCNVYADAFASLGIKPNAVMTGGSCLSKPLAEDYNKFVGWTLMSPMRLTAGGADSSPDVAEMLEAWDKYADTEKPGTYAELGWATLVNAVGAIEAAAPAELTPETAATAFEAYKGDAVIGGPGVDCSLGDSIMCREPKVFGYSVTADGLELSD